MTSPMTHRDRELPVVSPQYLPKSYSPGLERELEVLAKLHSLAQVSWSPTLRANSHLLKRRLMELRRSKIEAANSGR